ncbi:MAG: hypothetical protein ACLR0N_07815 [Bilophila wadsworthia]
MTKPVPRAAQNSMATHAKKKFRLFVRRTELHCCKTAAQTTPDREKDGTRSGKQDEPAEMRNDETPDELKVAPAPEDR